MAFCPACGGWIPEGESICYQCGYVLSSADESDDENDY